METRYIGDAVIVLEHVGAGIYRGEVRTRAGGWRFADLRAPDGWRYDPTAPDWDAPEAYDELARAAASLGSYYTSHNRPRGDAEVPAWAPPADLADAIDAATVWALDDHGQLEVRRPRRARDRSLRPADPRDSWR